MSSSQFDKPVYFPAAGEVLFGIHTLPSSEPRRVGIVIVAGGDNVNAAFSRNQVGARLARRLGAEGYDVLRFTYHGVGESTGVVESLHLHRPFTEDVIGAVQYLRGEGVDSVVLIGSCFGSRTALSSAEQIPTTAGVILITPPSAGYDRAEAMAEWMARNRTLGDYARRGLSFAKLKDLFHPGKRRTYWHLLRKKCVRVCRKVLCALRLMRDDTYDWVSPMFLGPLRAMVSRQVPVLFLFGTHDAWGAEFREAAQGPLGEILEEGASTIDVIEDLPGVAHGLVRVSVQEATMDAIVPWVLRRVPGQVTAPSLDPALTGDCRGLGSAPPHTLPAPSSPSI